MLPETLRFPDRLDPPRVLGAWGEDTGAAFVWDDGRELHLKHLSGWFASAQPCRAAGDPPP